MKYSDFLEAKRIVVPEVGFEPSSLPSFLYPFQRELVATSLRRGRSAMFEECGLGKTGQQLAWACACAEKTGKPSLVLAPLAVAKQTVREGIKFNLPAEYSIDGAAAKGPVVVTNYERLAGFEPSRFGAVVLDESSILKAYSGVTKRRLLEAFAATPYRLCCSATPAPNDHLELGNHSEFLSVLSSHQMIARWFINDTSTFGTYRLKGHATEDFWDWVSSWAAMCAVPSDVAPEYSDGGYVLPALETVTHVVDVDVTADRGENLFRIPELSATSVHQERRRTVSARAQQLAAVVRAEPGEHWVVWAETDYETDALAALLPEAMVVRGSDSAVYKEAAAEWFCGYGPRLDGKCTCGSLSMPSSGDSVPPTTPPSATSDDSKAKQKTRKSGAPTTETGSSGIESTSPHTGGPTPRSETKGAGSATPKTQRTASGQRPDPGNDVLLENGMGDSLPPTESPLSSTTGSSPSKAEAVRSAAGSETSTPARASASSTSTTATEPAESEASSARAATSASASSRTTRTVLIARPCTCGSAAGRILISKPRIFGWGLNFQHCARVAFASATFSFESYYQAIRRCWRFGQSRPVQVHIAMGATERAVVDVLNTKRAAFEQMRDSMMAAARRRQHRHASSGAYTPTKKLTVPSWLKSEVA